MATTTLRNGIDVDFLGSFSQEDVHQVLQQLPDHFRAAVQ